MSAASILIGMFFCIMFLLQLFIAGAIAYAIYQDNHESEPLIYKFAGPGKPLSDGQILVPATRQDEFLTSVAAEQAILNGGVLSKDKNKDTEAPGAGYYL